MFRTDVIRALRNMRAWEATLINLFQAPSLTWYDAGDGQGARWQDHPDRAGKRNRRDVKPEEYPENDAVALFTLVDRIDDIVEQADAIRAAAIQRLEALLPGDETVYLLRSRANAQRLRSSLKELKQPGERE